MMIHPAMRCSSHLEKNYSGAQPRNLYPLTKERTAARGLSNELPEQLSVTAILHSVIIFGGVIRRG